MSFQSNLRKVASRIRGTVPRRFGTRDVYSVEVRTTTWDGARRGEGGSSVDTVRVRERGGGNPKVRWLSTEEIALGSFKSGTLEVGPITPGAGTVRDALNPDPVGSASEVVWVVTGPSFPDGATFAVREVRDDRGYQMKVVLERSSG